MVFVEVFALFILVDYILYFLSLFCENDYTKKQKAIRVVAIALLSAGVVSIFVLANKKPKKANMSYEEPSYSSEYVYITDTGHCYHRKHCQYLAQSKYSITLEEAKESGYGPCSRCNPPK